MVGLAALLDNHSGSLGAAGCSFVHAVDVAPGVHVAALVPEVVRLLGPAAAVDVGDGLGLAAVDGVEEGVEDPPGDLELVAAHKVLLVAADAVEDETLVRLGDAEAVVAGLVAEVHLAHVDLHERTKKQGITLRV